MNGNRVRFCTAHCRGRQLGDPSGEAASAPLKGELLSEAKLRGFHDQLTHKPLRYR